MGYKGTVMSEIRPYDQRFYDTNGEPNIQAIYESFCADAPTFLDEHPEPFQDLVDDQGLDLSENEYPAFVRYVEDYEVLFLEDLSELSDAFDNFRENFQGYFDTEADFAEYIANEIGVLSDEIPTWIVINWQASWDQNLRHDYASEYIEELGLYAIFRNA